MEYTFMEPSDFDPEEWRSKPKEERAEKIASLIRETIGREAILEEAITQCREDIGDWLIQARDWGIAPRQLEEAGAGVSAQILRDRRARTVNRRKREAEGK